jgi:hypothetical protein
LSIEKKQSTMEHHKNELSNASNILSEMF